MTIPPNTPSTFRPAPRLTRPEFLATLASLGLFASGCSSSPTRTAPVMLPRFDPQSLLVGTQRVVVVLGTAAGYQQSATLLKTGPDTIAADVYDLTTNAMVAEATAPMFAEELPTAYWPFALELESAGSYELRAKIDGQDRSLAFAVLERSTPHTANVGDTLPTVNTPTVTDARGVNPICTNQPQCPFHTLDLAEVLAQRRRVLFYVGTPAYCQTGVCGPGLQFLIEAKKTLASDVAIIHAEVYTDDTIKATTDAVNTLGLTFEPCLFIVNADAMIVQRVDSVFADADLRALLAASGFLAP